ncbi:MAG: hypothetical protein EXS31_02050 [Pedosphaera sp.]|nr:hypothetical protein [Pedosphaera sp.]
MFPPGGGDHLNIGVTQVISNDTALIQSQLWLNQKALIAIRSIRVGLTPGLSDAGIRLTTSESAAP